MYYNKRKYVPFIYLAMVALFVLIFASATAYASAYFTATAKKQGTIEFHDVELEINSSNENDAIFSTTEKLMPGSSVDFSNVLVKNVGSTPVYSLVNLNVYIQKVGFTATSQDYWYNLEGGGYKL